MGLLTYWRRVCAPYLRAVLNPRTERGASLVEYALLIALLGVVCVVAVGFLGRQASKTFSGIGASLNP
jgi:pilus assembly protein Flp/PilA